MERSSTEGVTCHHRVIWSERQERWDTTPPHHLCHERSSQDSVIRHTAICRQVVLERWRWVAARQAAIASSIRGESIFLLIQVWWSEWQWYWQDRMRNKRRGCNAHLSCSMRSTLPEHVHEWVQGSKWPTAIHLYNRGQLSTLILSYVTAPHFQSHFWGLK